MNFNDYFGIGVGVKKFMATPPNQPKDSKKETKPTKAYETKKNYLPLIIIIVVAVVIIAGGVFLYFNQAGKTSINVNKSQTPVKTVKKPLVVGDIEEAFTLKADKIDTLGVEPESQFTLQSKNKIKTDVLKASLVVSPSFVYKLESSDNNNFKIIPGETLEPNTIYNFSLQAENESDKTQKRDYSWAYQIKDKFKITGTIPGDKATGVPLDSGIEITFSSENYYDYEKYVSFSPGIKGRFEQYRKTLVYIPEQLSEGAIYTVTIKKGLPLSGSEDVLEDDYIFSFETTPEFYEEGSLFFPEQFYEYPSFDTPTLTLTEYNTGLTSVDVNVWKFGKFAEFEDAVKQQFKIPAWAYYARQNFTYPTDSLIKAVTFKANLETVEWQKYFNFPDKLAIGQYLVEIEYQSKKIQTLLQISDMSASFYGSKKQGFIWLNDLTNKKPIEGAGITFSGDGDINLKTNADGLATFDTPAVLKDTNSDSYSYYFVVDYLNNKLLIPAENQNQYFYGWGYNDYAQTNNFWSYLYTNRNLYMPSDTIKFWGLARKRAGENIKEVKATLNSMGYYGEEKKEVIKEVTMALSSLGTYQGEIKYENLAPGTYKISTYAGDSLIATSYINIETYTKPAYKIEIETTKKAIFAGEDAVFSIKTEFFDGTPVPNLKLRYTGDLGEGSFTTDLTGSAVITLKTSFNQSDYYPKYNYFSVFPENSEMAVIESSAYLYIFGPHYSINLSTGYKENESSITGTVKEITLNKINSGSQDFYWDYEGNVVPGVKVNLKIYHIYYEKIETGTSYDFINKKTFKTYNYEPRENLVKEAEVVTNQDGAFQYSFAAEKDKNYRVEARATDGDNRTALSTTYLSSNSGYFGAWISSYYYLQLNKEPETSDRIVYKTGELVETTIKKGEETLPTSEGKNYLYFKDQNGIFDINLGNSPKNSFNFEESYIPNIFAHTIYFDGRVYREASQEIDVDKTIKELKIKIIPDKNEYEPGDQAKIDINVTDKSGKPVESEVNVSMIDEALAAIQWAEPLDILGKLYQSISWSVTTSYSTHEEIFMPMAERGGCFSGETKILMGDGRQKNIEDIKIGDYILTKTSEKSKELVKSKVLDKKEHVVSSYFIINNQLKITPVHIVYLNSQWQMVGNAKVGDYLVNGQGEKVRIKSIRRKYEYIKVYNLSTENQHTFLADGFYVHNEKGGARQNFQDVAYFDRVNTDSSGNARISFTLPDNITSWQVTTQAISKNLDAAGVRNALIVTKPFFVDIVMPENFLTADKPVIKLRGYGKSLNPADDVNFEVSFPDKKDFETQKYSVKAFESVVMSLPEFVEGEHSIKVKAYSTIFEDTIIKKFNVRKSNLMKNKVLYYLLSNDLKINEEISTNANFTFTNEERGKYYTVLRNLSWSDGDRLDQKMARLYSAKLLNEYYDEDLPLEDLNFTDFQVGEGGISILPYASADLLFTAKVLDLAPNVFDESAAKSYFNNVINNRNSNLDEITYAYYGLAALGEPVLTEITNFMNNQFLPPEYKMYLARAVDKLGATEYSQSIVKKILAGNGETVDPYIRLILGKEHDDMIEYTYQAAAILASSGASDASKLFDYAYQNPAQFHLNNLEVLSYLSKVLPRLSGEPVSFTYSLDGKDKDVSLENDEDYSLLVTPEQIKNIKFNNITGKVGLIVTYQTPFDLTTEKTDNNLSVKREYSVAGNKTATFSENDIVKITITPQIAKKAIDNEYQITDYLPAGLKILTNTYSRGLGYDLLYRYPYEINGQMVKFWMGKPSQTFTYYAIVTSKGTFNAEATYMQGFVAKESRTFGESEVIVIK